MVTVCMKYPLTPAVSSAEILLSLLFPAISFNNKKIIGVVLFPSVSLYERNNVINDISSTKQMKKNDHDSI